LARVELKNITKRYDTGLCAVNNVSLTIEDKEFVVLVGPSGCGKSTTLRMIAGLEEVSEGDIYIGDQRVNDVAAKNRDIAMVFQNYALYPHMSVYENMAFGLKLRRYPKKEIDARVAEAAEILGIHRYLKRKPKELSGGERQRVAVGRSIVRKPKVFLFDEPLSNLDAKLRVQMRTEIAKLHDRLQTTMIYVTHDQIEALTMGDRIVVMKDGLIQQVDSPLKLYSRPKNYFVAGFIGSLPMNFLKGVIRREKNKYFFQEGLLKMRVMDSMVPAVKRYEEKRIIMGIRPESIYDRLFAKDASDDFSVRATVDVVEPMGAEIYLYLKRDSNKFVARVSANDTAQVNQDLEVVFDMTKAHFFDPETEVALV
jgi:multiple sugar transport system ATP-binding protein